MNLEDQICSFNLARKLKKLGVKQESLFYWYLGTFEPFVDYFECGNIHRDYALPEIICSVFTVAELGEMLPRIINNKKIYFYSSFKTRDLDYVVEYAGYLDHKLGKSGYDKNEANARAKMLIYLIENKLITIGES